MPSFTDGQAKPQRGAPAQIPGVSGNDSSLVTQVPLSLALAGHYFLGAELENSPSYPSPATPVILWAPEGQGAEWQEL